MIVTHLSIRTRRLARAGLCIVDCVVATEHIAEFKITVEFLGVEIVLFDHQIGSLGQQGIYITYMELFI